MKNIIVTFAVALSFLSNQIAWAQGSTYFEIKEPPRAAEYIFRSSQKETLIGVQLLGAVKNPGIYYIPPTTDLLKLITLAGGEADANLSEVLVRKTDQSQQGVYELNVEKLMQTTDTKSFKLAQDDFIYIPKKEPWISNDVSRTVTVVSMIATIVLTAVLIDNNSKK